MKIYNNLSIKQKQIVWAWTFLALPVLFYVVIRFYPTFDAIVLSFQSWNMLGARKWVWFENYVKLFNDPEFWQVFRNTFLYLILGTPISLVLSFLIAYHLDKTRFLHGTLRALYFLPFLTSTVAMAWVWRWFYQPVPIGLFNNLLSEIGFAQVAFLNSTTNALPSILAPAIWAGLGFQIIIFMAGLRAIPRELLRGCADRRRIELDHPQRDHNSAVEADHRVSCRIFIDRIFTDFRSGLQHDHQQPRRATEFDQALGVDDLSNRIFEFRHGLRGGADSGFVHRVVDCQPDPAAHPEGQIR